MAPVIVHSDRLDDGEPPYNEMDPTDCETPPGLCSRLLTGEEEISALEPEWRALYAVSPSACAPLSYDWMSSWWKLYGHDYGRMPGGLRILAVRRDGELVGLAPFYLKKRRFLSAGWMGFLSSGETERDATCAEYLDLLYLPEERESVLAEVSRFLFETSLREWNDLGLSLVGESSMARSIFDSAPKRFVRRSSRFVSHAADLSSGFDAYLSRLSANSRQQFRRLLRDAAKLGIDLEVAGGPEQAREFLGELISLHQERWRNAGKRGAFASDRAVRFHGEVLARLLPRKEAIISRVRAGGTTIAVIYGFVANGKFDFYQSGVMLDGAGPVKRPGILSHLLTMRYLASLGVTTYDFLAGDSEYKARMATCQSHLHHLTLAKPSLATFFKVAELKARGLARGGIRVFAGLTAALRTAGIHGEFS